MQAPSSEQLIKTLFLLIDKNEEKTVDSLEFLSQELLALPFPANQLEYVPRSLSIEGVINPIPISIPSWLVIHLENEDAQTNQSEGIGFINCNKHPPSPPYK